MFAGKCVQWLRFSGVCIYMYAIHADIGMRICEYLDVWKFGYLDDDLHVTFNVNECLDNLRLF